MIEDYQIEDDRHIPKKIGQMWHLPMECYVIITSILDDGNYICFILKNNQGWFGEPGTKITLSFDTRSFEYFLIGDVA